MITDRQLDANRQNALQSTGPKTVEGVAAVKLNALRHGLRSVQTVVPGEDPAAWEAHQAAVIEDMRPAGALEYALAEQVAVKLWRLGRVVLFEANAIGNAQHPDELAHTHESRHKRSYGGPARTDIPLRSDVERTNQEVESARKKVADFEASLRILEALGELGDKDPIEHVIYEPLRQDLQLTEKELGKLFTNDDEPFMARDVRSMLKTRGTLDEMTKEMVTYWREKKLPDLRVKVVKAEKTHKALIRRYKAAVERLRLSHGLPEDAALEKIQRYEAHLERGLHKALERLQSLQEARGAKPTTINNLAVVQGSYREPEMASFGNSSAARGSELILG
jgi:hypothetical protein